MLVKYLTSLNLVPFSILQKHIFGDPWLLFLLKSNNVLCGSLCSENSSQVNRVIAAVNTQGSIFSVDIRDIGSLTKKIKYKDNVIKINCKARFESQLRCSQPAGHYQIWLISLTHHFLNHGYGNNHYLSLIRLISMFSEAVLKKFICDILEDTLLREKCQKSAFSPPGSMPIRCLSEAWVFRGEHWFVRRWSKAHSHLESHTPSFGGSPLDWDLFLRANRCLSWLSSAGELSISCAVA